MSRSAAFQRDCAPAGADRAFRILSGGPCARARMCVPPPLHAARRRCCESVPRRLPGRGEVSPPPSMRRGGAATRWRIRPSACRVRIKASAPSAPKLPSIPHCIAGRRLGQRALSRNRNVHLPRKAGSVRSGKNASAGSAEGLGRLLGQRKVDQGGLRPPAGGPRASGGGEAAAPALERDGARIMLRRTGNHAFASHGSRRQDEGEPGGPTAVRHAPGGRACPAAFEGGRAATPAHPRGSPARHGAAFRAAESGLAPQVGALATGLPALPGCQAHAGAEAGRFNAAARRRRQLPPRYRSPCHPPPQAGREWGRQGEGNRRREPAPCQN